MPAADNPNPAKIPERFATDITPLVYDLQFRPDARDVTLWTKWCLEVGGPVLELGCGSGRIAIPLARAGLEVVGVDLWEPMLTAARKRLSAEPPEVQRRVHLEQGDMRRFRPGVQVACAIIPANTFGVLLTRQEQQRALGGIHSCLTLHGKVAFDLPVFTNEHPWLADNARLAPVRRTSADGAVDFTEERCFTFDRDSKILTSTNVYLFDRPEGIGAVAERVRSRVVSRAEAEEALAKAGFVVEAVWGYYDRQPFTINSGKMIFAATAAQ
jgi:SAM-dependent methyltransferase